MCSEKPHLSGWYPFFFEIDTRHGEGCSIHLKCSEDPTRSQLGGQSSSSGSNERPIQQSNSILPASRVHHERQTSGDQRQVLRSTKRVSWDTDETAHPRCIYKQRC